MTVTELDSGRVRFIDAAHAGEVYSVNFSPDGNRLVSAGSDDRVHIWNITRLLAGPSSEIESPAESHAVRGVQFVDGGKTACSAESNGRIRLWSSRDGQPLDDFEVDWPGTMIQLAACPDRSLLAVTCGHWPPQELPGRVEIWDANTVQLHSICELPHGILYSLSSFSRDGRFLAVCSKNHVVVIDVANKQLHRELAFEKWVKSVDFSPDGRLLACAEVAGKIHLFDTRDFIKRRPPITEGVNGPQCIAFSPDSRLLAVGGFGNCVTLIDTATGQLEKHFDKCQSYLVGVRFSPNGRRIVSASSDGEIRIWNASTGDELLRFDTAQGWYPKVEFSADGRSLAVAGGPMAKVYRSADAGQLSRLSVVELNDIACQDIVEYRPW